MHVDQSQGVTPVVKDFILFKSSNNIDGVDNLDTLLEEPAIYGIFGRANGKPVNCRHIGLTADLRQTIKLHFSDSEPDEMLRKFMQSIKLKTIAFTLTKNLTEEEVQSYYQKWHHTYQPNSQSIFNIVY